MVSPLSFVWQQVKLSGVSLRTRPRYIPVPDKDVKKSTKQTNKSRHTDPQEEYSVPLQTHGYAELRNGGKGRITLHKTQTNT